MLRNYGASDICWSFGDAVCITAPGNHRLHPQMTVLAPCIKTTPRVSVTKAVGLYQHYGYTKVTGQSRDTCLQVLCIPNITIYKGYKIKYTQHLHMS